MSAQVKRLQEYLCLLGHYPYRSGIDGIAGKAFRGAVLSFRADLRRRGVPVAWSDTSSNAELAVCDAQIMGYMHEAATTGEINGVAIPRVPHDEQLTNYDLAPEVIAELVDKMSGGAWPVALFLAMVQHECHGLLTVQVGGHRIVIWGADWTGTNVSNPDDTESLDSDKPIKSRGWGPGQVTPPGGALPEVDAFGTGIAQNGWPLFVTDGIASLATAGNEVFADKFRYKSSLKIKCRNEHIHDCKRCIDSKWPAGQYKHKDTQRDVCSWLEAVRRYAGSGVGADEFVEECRDILLGLEY